MDSYLKGLWWLAKQSMILFKSQKSLKSDIEKSVLGCSISHYFLVFSHIVVINKANIVNSVSKITI